MKRKKKAIILITITAIIIIIGITLFFLMPKWIRTAYMPTYADSTKIISKIKLPKGFKISIYAKADGARSMSLSESGILFIGTRGEGKVYAAVDRDGNYEVEEILVIDSGLNMPNGVAIYNNSLYVFEINI